MAESPAKVIAPGEYIRDELRARGWKQDDLARILDRPLPTVNEIIQAKRAIMPEMAIALAAAFGTTPEIWMEREAAYRLSLVKTDATGDVQRRVRLYDLAPIKEMQKRGWIKPTDDAKDLEKQLLEFFCIATLDDEPELAATMRKSASYDDLTPSQRAWCFRARQLATSQIAPAFRPENFEACIANLRKLAAYAPEVKKVSRVLLENGVRFVIVEPLAGSKIDGAAFWMDDQPAIAISLRHDRIDAFWFTLFHECSHIRHKDSVSIDSQLVGDDAMPSLMKPPIERRADKEASESLIPSAKIDSFINRIAPLFSKERIVQFAHLMKIHPGIIVGQLQHRGQIGFHANREMLVKVREIAIATGIVDGWGHTINTESNK